MKFAKFTLVTIVVEPILAAQIKNEIQEMGSSGITATDVQGEGSRHLHSGEIPGNKVKIECIVDAEMSENIMKHISDKYFGNYSLIVYSNEVDVLRAEKFKGQK